MNWYQETRYQIYVGVGVLLLVILIIVLTRPAPYDPLAALTKTIRYIKNGTYADQFDTERIDINDNVFPILNVGSAQISSYYGGTQYQQDMTTLLQLCSDTAGVKSLPSDCYSLSTTNTALMTLDDQQRIGNNLLLKIVPSLTILSDQKKYGDMSGILILFFNIVYSILGVNGSNFIVPTYDSANQLVSVQYSNSIDNTGRVQFLPVSYYLGILSNGYGTNHVQVPKMTDTQITAFLTAQAVPVTQTAIVTSLIRNVTNPLNDQMVALQEYSATTDIPAIIFPQLVLTLLFTVLAGGVLRYNGVACS
jgi:hypothetical protein